MKERNKKPIHTWHRKKRRKHISVIMVEVVITNTENRTRKNGVGCRLACNGRWGAFASPFVALASNHITVIATRAVKMTQKSKCLPQAGLPFQIQRKKKKKKKKNAATTHF